MQHLARRPSLGDTPDSAGRTARPFSFQANMILITNVALKKRIDHAVDAGSSVSVTIERHTTSEQPTHDSVRGSYVSDDPYILLPYFKSIVTQRVFDRSIHEHFKTNIRPVAIHSNSDAHNMATK